MASTLQLKVTDYIDETRWRWELSTDKGQFLADHEVRLDRTSREYSGFRELSQYLDYHQPISPPEQQLAALGAWIGEKVFGGLLAALKKHSGPPARAVQVSLPQAAQALLFRPFELARFGDKKTFREAGLRFVYHLEGMPDPKGAKEPADKSLRVLATFSLPVRLNPLNLRRERYGMQRLVNELNQTRGVAIDLRVLQYGATREMLREALEEADGWDIIHLSGHGNKGELLLENEQGSSDTINAEELGKLLAPAHQRLKLLILDMCYSGTGTHEAARVQVGLDQVPVRQEGAKNEPTAEAVQTTLPSLAQALAQQLDCAALAMRYPVGDAFATELMLSLYRKLLEKRQPLPAALHLALDEALRSDIPCPPLSAATPILVGARAAELTMVPPQQPPQETSLPRVGLTGFPPEPERFVGRLQPMLRASHALAPRSPLNGALFYGMPGAGKTACALELTYRHSKDRFQGYVWYRAPEEGSDISSALLGALLAIEEQLEVEGHELTRTMVDPEGFRRSLTRLKALLQQKPVLLVLDNLESLLSDSNRWRDPQWGEFVAALLEHTGRSRVVLTSRRLPAGLEKHPRLLLEAVHALSLAESVLLARDLPHLKRLFDDKAGQELLRNTLRVVQGHPKLLELANSLAADRAALAARVAAAEAELSSRGAELDAFFALGGTREGETRQADSDFVAALQGWTAGVTSNLSATARLLFDFLCQMEPLDRMQLVVQANWKDFLTRLGDKHPVAMVALAEPDQGLTAALKELENAGLVDSVKLAEGEEVVARLASHGASDHVSSAVQALQARVSARVMYTIHPGVAESARGAADPAVLAAADKELGDFYLAMLVEGLRHEMEGAGRAVTVSARSAAPYLLRQERWREGAIVLEHMVARDDSPTTLAFGLPLLHRIAEATAGTNEGLNNAMILAKALVHVGRMSEAEKILRDIITSGTTQGNYRLASASRGILCNLLQMSGRLPEALQVAEEMADYTRQAGLGPWSQLTNDGLRLQILNAMGRYNEVLAAFKALRPRMDALPVKGESDEMVKPWNVREALLNTAHTATTRINHWEESLEFTAEIVNAQQARGADVLEVTRTRFNDYSPLLNLGRYAEARDLLMRCQLIFKEKQDVSGLAKVYDALANLEFRSGRQDAAVRFAQVSMSFRYQIGQPEPCAISHNNLANYLNNQGGDPATVLAHRLADAIISLQIQSGLLSTSLSNISHVDLAEAPPTFTSVVEQVEAIEGVRFRALFERLPRTVPDGDAAIAMVWKLAGEERAKRETLTVALRSALPSDLMAAVQSGDRSQFVAALQHLPPEQQRTILEQMQSALRAAGIDDPVGVGPDMDQVLSEFEPLLQDIAAVAKGDDSPRAAVEATLPQLAENGWELSSAVQRIWAGERDEKALTSDIDPNSARLVRRVLELLPQ